MLLFMSIASALVTDWSSTVDHDLLSLVVVAGARADHVTGGDARICRCAPCHTARAHYGYDVDDSNAHAGDLGRLRCARRG